MDDIYDITDDVNLEDEHKEYAVIRRAPPQAEWFHGKISREDASTLLATQQLGTYLVRESIRDMGDFSISFRVTGGVKHFKVIGDEYGGFFIADQEFSTLSEVVERYCNECLSDNMTLTHPLKPKVGVENVHIDQVVEATKAYVAMGNDEISFEAGERLVVRKASDPHWLWVTKQGSTEAGYAPRSLLKDVEASAREASVAYQLPISHHRSQWLHMAVTRQDAEKMLTNARVGEFLIRESSGGAYSLSFRSNKRIQHIKISIKDGVIFECGGRSFDCLEAIVLRYMREPLVDETCLSNPIPPVRRVDQTLDVDGDLYSAVQFPGALAQRKRESESNLLYASLPKPKDIVEKQTTLKSSNANVKTGYIVKKNPKNKKWKKLYFTLYASRSRLYYFDSEQALKPKGIIDLQSSYVYSLDDSFFGRPNCFQIIVNGTAEVYLCCDTEPDKWEWVSAIGEYSAGCGVAEPSNDPAAKSEITSLKVSVMESKNLNAKVTSPYCILSLNSVKHGRTPWKPVKNQAAFWSEEFTFDNISPIIQEFKLELLQHGKNKDKLIGSFTLPLSSLTPNTPIDKWVEITHENQVVGSVRFKATYLLENILPKKDYEELHTLLVHKDLGSPLVIAEANRSSMNDVARSLLLVWRADKKEVELVSLLLNQVVQSETDVATLFRGNSLATKAVDQYMKMVGIHFLHSAVGQVVRDLFETKLPCELDPTRGGKPENAKNLLSFATRIVEDVNSALATAPGELRLIMSNLVKTVETKFPKEKLVRYTAVSAFLFLRLICPAIMNPKLFNMMPDHPTEETARNLTLVAKIVQNLANMSEFGQKEPHMTVCNEFLMVNRGKMQSFIDTFVSSHNSDSAEALKINPARPLASVLRFCINKKEEIAKLAAASSAASAKNLENVVTELSKKVA